MRSLWYFYPHIGRSPCETVIALKSLPEAFHPLSPIKASRFYPLQVGRLQVTAHFLYQTFCYRAKKLITEED